MSNVVKSEVKIFAAQEIGVAMDDLLESAQAEVNKCLGAKAALLSAAKTVGHLSGHIDKDVEGGLFDEEASVLIKRYVARAVSGLENLAQSSGNQHLIAIGRVQALEKAVESIKKFQDSERAKMAVKLAAEAREAEEELRAAEAEDAEAVAAEDACDDDRGTLVHATDA